MVHIRIHQKYLSKLKKSLNRCDILVNIATVSDAPSQLR